VCDSDPRSIRALRTVLGAAALDVDTTTTAERALDRAAIRLPDAAIVALELHDRDGVEVCRQLRQWSAMPLLILGATDDEDETVRALEAGADDYITKPFGPRELVARLHATMRRAEPVDEEPCIRLDGLEVDLAARVLRHDDRETRLTPIEFKLLRVLLLHRGRPLAHDLLLRRVWGPAWVDDAQTLRVHIARLRRKMRPSTATSSPITVSGTASRTRPEHAIESAGSALSPGRPPGRCREAPRFARRAPRSTCYRVVTKCDWRAVMAPYR